MQENLKGSIESVAIRKRQGLHLLLYPDTLKTTVSLCASRGWSKAQRQESRCPSVQTVSRLPNAQPACESGDALSGRGSTQNVVLNRQSAIRKFDREHRRSFRSEKGARRPVWQRWTAVASEARPAKTCTYSMSKADSFVQMWSRSKNWSKRNDEPELTRHG